MKQGKYAAPVRRRRRRNTLKPMLIAMAVVLLLGCVTGGTLAWLTSTTPAVVNTFTTSDIDITLTETFNTDSNNDGKNDKWVAQMIPGYSYTKDPVVTVKGGSEDCWLFVKFEEKYNASTYLTYISTLTETNGWTQGDGTKIPKNVWYRSVTKSNDDQSWHLLSGDTVTVNAESVTKDTMDAAADAELVYTAAAVQYYSTNDTPFSVTDAYAKVVWPATTP